MREIETQKAIYDVLKARCVADVYDHVPQDAAYPYIIVSDSEAEDFDTDDTVGADHTFDLHVWSRYRGAKETRDIQRAIWEELHRAELTIEGAHLVNCEIEFSGIFLDDDGLTRHGTQRLRVIIDEVD